MREYCYRRKLFLIFLANSIVSLMGCHPSGDDQKTPIESPMPDLVNADELAKNYATYVGKPILLKARIDKGPAEDYIVLGSVRNDWMGSNRILEFNLILSERYLQPAEMEHCLNVETIISGTVENNYVISVSRIKLAADALIHKQSHCYRVE